MEKKKYLFLREEELKGKKDGDYLSYRQLIDHYVNNGLILNNDIMKETFEIGYWETWNGEDYNEEEDYYKDVYQYYIIDEYDADRLADDTDELIYYNETLNLYLLGVTHFGTPWDGVSTDYIITTDYNKYREQEEKGDE